MKKILFSMYIFCAFFSCKNLEPSILLNDQLNNPPVNFDWLLGNWERTNEEAGKQTFEKWAKVNSVTYHGFGFTLQNQDTIWQENISLIKRDTIWNFEVTGQGEKQPTVFKIKNYDRNRFTAENQMNEFPRIITYSRRGDNLHAVISGGGTEILFDFVPLEKDRK